LVELPEDGWEKLNHLMYLNLSSNDIQDLPGKLGLIQSLKSLSIVGNPSKTLLRWMDKPTPKLLEWLRSQL